ncbi:MAG: hypothetical protein LBU67_00695 [Oscillospiraceae bacterium]|nr:hypothetical protein [Oscillospiraceae bacterium]
MYRYAAPRSARSRNQQTLLFLLTLALAITCISLLFAYLRASSINVNTHSVLISRMQSEVSQAKTRAYQLTQTGGSKIESMIAMVRQHVYAMRVINEMSSGVYGAGTVLVQDALINDCITFLDQCDAKLQTGSVLMETYALLRVAIDKLYENTALLK